jgi:hypothetical protein
MSERVPDVYVWRVLTRKTGHGYTIGTLDLSDDTVSLDGGGDSGNDGERVTHLDGYRSWYNKRLEGGLKMIERVSREKDVMSSELSKRPAQESN